MDPRAQTHPTLVFPAVAGDRRRSRRRLVPDVFVMLGAPTSQKPSWAGNAVDINGDGLGLALPPEVEVGSEVLLSFRLGDTAYERLPATVLRQDREFGVGAVRFGGWPLEARQALLSFLLER
jgi:hypothetical protein